MLVQIPGDRLDNTDIDIQIDKDHPFPLLKQIEDMQALQSCRRIREWRYSQLFNKALIKEIKKTGKTVYTVSKI